MNEVLYYVLMTVDVQVGYYTMLVVKQMYVPETLVTILKSDRQQVQSSL